jgi:predicted nucleotidyltransferase
MASTATRSDLDPAIVRFAHRLSQEIGATQVLLFGSRARSTHDDDSDYDIIIVSEQFEGVNPLHRGRGLRPLFYEVGGDAPMDLFCLTPEEFKVAKDRISLISSVAPDAIDLLAA